MVRVVVVAVGTATDGGIAQVLDAVDDIDIVGVAASAGEAVSLARSREPDVVLMDLSGTGGDGVAATRRLVAASPHVRVIALTHHVGDERVPAMLDAGAVAYLLREADPDELAAGIRTAAHDAPGHDVRLTDREREVLALVVAGLANKQIGRRLGITEATVKTHLTKVFRATGASNRTEAVAWARRHDLG